MIGREKIISKPSPPKAVIVGTGHHGSGYIARVLTESGIPTGHEEYYSYHLEPRKEVLVDSSWLATGHLEGLEGIVWHQVRHPLKVVTSLATSTQHHYEGDPYGDLRWSLSRPPTGELVTDAMATYVDVNNHCESYASKRWRVEDVYPPLIVELGRELGIPISPFTAELAIRGVSRKTNQHTRAVSLGWDDLPDIPLKENLREMADRYGY